MYKRHPNWSRIIIHKMSKYLIFGDDGVNLHMNICDVNICLEICNYKKPDEEHESDWCDTNFSLKSKYIDYNIDGWELFLNDEVDHLKSTFKDLLKGVINGKCTVRFAEPDFEFDMRPIITWLYNIGYIC